MIPGRSILLRIEEVYAARFGTELKIHELVPVVGGSINRTFQLKTDQGDLFLKQNNARLFPDMFEAEAKGMKLLMEHSSFVMPEMLFTDVFRDDALLVMEFIPHGTKGTDFFEQFGRVLAKMHRKTADAFGLDHDNYIGSLRQSNKQHAR